MAALCVALVSSAAYADKPAGVTAQTVTLPSGPTSLKGLGESFEPNIATGTGSYSVGIELPPGFVQPSLSIGYSGGSGKGELGVGWQLPVLHIYRSTDKGAPNLDEDDRFSVSGPGINDELVRVSTREGLYRLKNEGAFVLFERHAAADSWTVHFPSGERALLGTDEESRQTSLGRAYKWFIAQQEDRFGHFTRYEYLRDAGHVYLDSIHYQLHAAPEYQNHVKLHYQIRPDVFTDYRYGDECRTQLRLSRIEVRHAERLLRTYELEYGNSLLFSLLRSVRMTGEGGKLALPTLRFNYLADSRESGELVAMERLPPLEGLADGLAELDDVNGDGLPDLIYGVAGDYHYYANLDGRRFDVRRVRLENSPDRHLFEAGVQFADLNGDGFRDLVHPQGERFRYYPAGPIENGVFTGFEAPVELDTQAGGFHFGDPRLKLSDLNSDGRIDLVWQKPGRDTMLLNLDDVLVEEAIEELPADVDFRDPRVMLTDFNGDGVLDFVLNGLDYTSSRVRVWFGLGKGRYAREQAMANVPSSDPSEFHFEDVNHDGQTDLVRVSGSWATYYLNDGDLGYTGKRGDFYGLPSVSTTRKLLFADMNGNGSRDLVWYTTNDELLYLDMMGEPNAGLLSRVDNGMGAVTTLSYRSSTSYAIEARENGEPWRHPLNSPVPVLSEIRTTDSFDKLGFAATQTRTTYVYRDGYYDGKEREFRGFGQVTTTEHGDGHHETLVTETHMHVGRNPLNGADEEILKGKPFMQLQRGQDGALLASTETQWEQRWLCQEDLVGVSREVLPSCSRYANLDEAKDELVAFAVQPLVLQGAWEGTKEPRFSATRLVYDDWGNATRTEKLGEVRFSGWHEPGERFDLTHADVRVGNDEVVEETAFLYDPNRWLIGLAYEERLREIGGRLLRHSRSHYDGANYTGLPLGQAERGKVTREQVWLREESRWIDARRIALDVHGQPRSTLDANGNESQLDYDAETGSFALAERVFVERGALEFRAEYDRGFGVVTDYTDLNGYHSLLRYDALARLVRILGPEDDDEQPLARYKYRYGTSDDPISVTTIEELVDRETGSYRLSYAYADGSGRTRLTKAQAEAEHGFIATGWVQLSARGSEARVFDAFASQYEGFEAPPTSTPSADTYFDALGRETYIYEPQTAELGATYTLRQYLPFEARVYDERETSAQAWQHPSISRMDGRGRVREVEKTNSAPGGVLQRLRWRIGYSAADEVVSIADPMWSEDPSSPFHDDRYQRHYAYDSLGRPLWIRDPSMGVIRYEHDDVGNLTRRLDALQQEVTWEYGNANRPRARHARKNADGRADYSYRFHYDEADPSGPIRDATNLLGQLAWVEFPTGEDHYDYDLYGHQVREARLLWNPLTSNSGDQSRDLFIQRTAYTTDDAVRRIEAPGGLTVDYQHNARRLLESVTARLGDTVRSPVAGLRYEARGLVTEGEHGNGTRSCRSYDERGQLVGTLTGKVGAVTCAAVGGTAGVGTHHLHYQRIHNGLIGRIDDLSVSRPSIMRLDATYGYDAINQLIQAEDEVATLQFRYDSIQNLIGRDIKAGTPNLPSGDFRYGEAQSNGQAAGPNMVTSAGGQTYSYDKLGQLEQYSGYELTFDTEGQLVQADKADKHLEFHYDAWGKRRIALLVDQNGPSEVQRFVFDSYQLREQAQSSADLSVDELWHIGTPLGVTEVRRADGIVIDATLLAQLSEYLAGLGTDVRPLPVEFFDLDGDGDSFDRDDYDVAEAANIARAKAGGVRDVWTWHHRDQLGGTTHVTDSEGELVSHQAFHPYGVRSARRGGVPALGYAGANDEVDADLGLLYFQARYYAPKLGRWISPDSLMAENPAMASARVLENNLYSYAGNNPVFYTDASGQFFIVAAVLVVSAAIAYVGVEVAQAGANAANKAFDPKAKIDNQAIDRAQNDATKIVLQQAAAEVIGPLLARVMPAPTPVLNAASKGTGEATKRVVTGQAAKTRERVKRAESTAGKKKAQPDGQKITGPDTMKLGPHAKETIPARSKAQRFTKAERKKTNELGKENGCHTCGVKESGRPSGNYTPDHQPVSATVPDGTPQVLAPHCATCSAIQGGHTSALKRAGAI